MPAQAPCDWPLAIPDETKGCLPCEALYELNDEQQMMVTEMAVELLWNWTHRKYGTCEVEVRPCRVDCTPYSSTFWGNRTAYGLPQIGGWAPALLGGEWYNIRCGVCPQPRCTCDDTANSIILPGPVAEIVEIIVDGEILPVDSWLLRDGILYRVDGGVWPECNDQSADPLDPTTGAWTVTYLKGYPVPAGGRLAAYNLACELAKDLLGRDDCQLPQRLQSVTREGVSMAILDGFEGLDDGKTGIWGIDAWIASVTAPRPVMPRVYSPDIAPQRGTATGLGQGRRV